MRHFIGLDVSQRLTAVCVLSDDGEIVVEGKAATDPQAIHDWLHDNGISVRSVVKAGLEAGAMSHWLCTGLRGFGLPVICLEAFQAHRFLKTCRNKNDRNDARGLAQLVRMGGGFVRAVPVRSEPHREARTLLIVRQNLVNQKVTLENNITGSLKPYGLIVRRGDICAARFRERVLSALDKCDEMGVKLRAALMPSLNLHAELCRQLQSLDRQVEKAAKTHPVCRLLMTTPGVGPIVALSYVTAIDDPRRFSRSEDIGAYFGLTPRQYQSGETDHQENISRLGNAMTRQHLVQAATVLLISTKRWSSLKSWGIKIAKKRGMRRARIAVARKLATVLHRIWINNEPFRWSAESEALAAQEVA